MQLAVHEAQGTPALDSLDDYRTAIEGEVDRMCLRVGALLLAAKADHPDDFRRWVDEDLPFGRETARRLMAVAIAYATCPPALLDRLPRPMQALYALRRVPPLVLASAVEAGMLGPATSTIEASEFARSHEHRQSYVVRHTRADIAAGVVIDSDPSDLHPMVLRALLKWCRQVGS